MLREVVAFPFQPSSWRGAEHGEVGFGSGKAGEVPEAISKASRIAKKSMKRFLLKEGRTIPHEVVGEFGAARVILIPSGSRNRE